MNGPLGILGNYLFLKETKYHDLNCLEKYLLYLEALTGHSQALNSSFQCLETYKLMCPNFAGRKLGSM